MSLGPRRDENPFAMLAMAAVQEEQTYHEQPSAIPVIPSSGDETILPGWVRAMGGQVAQLQ
eukprot:4466110-Heterocapsa_arctica.AAC.1